MRAHTPNEEMIQMGATKKELEEQLRAQGQDVPAGASKEDLQRLADAGDLGKSADVAVDGHHPNSIIEDVPVEDKPAPNSVMQREIRPDEQDLPPGTSALQTAPPAAVEE